MSLLPLPQYVGTATLNAHIRRAAEFAARTDVYLAIGKTSAWTDDNSPPTPDTSAAAVTEVIGYVKVTKNTLVVPASNGSNEIYGVMWNEVSIANAYTSSARHVWLQGEVAYDALPVNVSYRQIGIYTGLIKASGVPAGQTVLLPAEVQTAGVLEYLYNDRPIPRAINRRDVINVIITF